MKEFIEQKIKKIDDQNDVQNISKNVYQQIDQFIDTILVEASSNSEKSYESCVKGLLSLKTFVNKNIVAINNLIIQKNSFKGLIDAYEKEEKIKNDIIKGKDPQQRDVGEKPVSLREVRNIKSKIVNNEDFDVEEE